MKKNILSFLMSSLFFTAAVAQAQEWGDEDSCRYEDNFSINEDSCCGDETSYYAKIFTGANFLQNTTIEGNKATYQTGYIIAGSLGYCWDYGLRLEAEYAYRRNAIRKIDFFTDDSSKNGHFQTSSFMANLLWDLPLSSWGCACWDIQPFVGAGIGYDFQQMHSSNPRIVFNQKWNQFSWQMMAGLAYPIYCNTEITLEYKLHQGGHFINHSVGVGLIYKFGLGSWCYKPDRAGEAVNPTCQGSCFWQYNQLKTCRPAGASQFFS